MQQKRTQTLHKENYKAEMYLCTKLNTIKLKPAIDSIYANWTGNKMAAIVTLQEL